MRGGKISKNYFVFFTLALACGLILGCSAEIEPGNQTISSQAPDQENDQVLKPYLEPSEESRTGDQPIIEPDGSKIQSLPPATPVIKIEPQKAGENIESTRPVAADDVGNPEDSDVVSSSGELNAMANRDGEKLETEMAGNPPAINQPELNFSVDADDQNETNIDSKPWRTFVDQNYGFTFQYPEDFNEVLAKPEPNPSIIEPLEIIGIQAHREVDSNLTNLEPNHFSVVIYPNLELLVVNEWLETYRPEVKQEFYEIEQVLIQDKPATKVCALLDIAPNCFFYVDHRDFIVEIIPYGEYSTEILESFIFLDNE